MRLTCLLALLATAGCGGGTGPAPNLSGGWIYTATDMVGGGLTCRLDDVQLQLVHEASTVSGSTVAGTIRCQVGGESSDPIALSEGTVTGTVEGRALTFDVTQGANVAQHQGTIGSAEIAGTVSALVDFGQPVGTVVLEGTFRAARD